jgi:hypothetical protein
MNATRYWSWSLVWDFILGALSLERGALSLGYLLSLVLLPESFYISKVMMLGGGCVPMVG